ncbi:MAG: sulfotransferase [Acidobacteriaceae bacterium]
MSATGLRPQRAELPTIDPEQDTNGRQFAMVRGRLRALPTFFIVGPPRTGTTWLHDVLRSATNLPAPTKETRYFDLHFDRGLGWYLDRYPLAVNGLPRGEVAPTYFASPFACDRIARVAPEAKIVFIFRHPVERLVSLYRLKRAYGLLGWNLEAALDRDPELIASSRYATHFARWQQRFPGRQLFAAFYDDLSADPQLFVDRIADFVGISRIPLRDDQRPHVAATAHLSEPRSYLATRLATAAAEWCKAQGLGRLVAEVRNSALMKVLVGGGAPFPEIPPAMMQRILHTVLPEIDALEGMLDRDLSAWKSPTAL